MDWIEEFYRNRLRWKREYQESSINKKRELKDKMYNVLRKRLRLQEYYIDFVWEYLNNDLTERETVKVYMALQKARNEDEFLKLCRGVPIYTEEPKIKTMNCSTKGIIQTIKRCL